MGSLQDALLDTGLAEKKSKTDLHGRRQSGKKSGRDGGPNAAAKNRQSKRRASDGKSPSPKNTAASHTRSTDLERAYAARKKAERAEAEQTKQARVADQEARRKRNLELDSIVEGKALNQPEADLPRYFEHIGRIRRVLCSQQQRAAINAGELGVVNLRGRYLIVELEVLKAFQARAPDLIPDLSGREPEAEQSDGYPPVPDELSW